MEKQGSSGNLDWKARSHWAALEGLFWSGLTGGRLVMVVELLHGR